ncbi:MAG TPA: serine--tRNA ligase [Euryarchaeota archaeon]|nr:serine--tRNA ligase [Euryarchaeota archaeon]
MLDPKVIRDSPETIRTALRNRGYDQSMLDRFQELDEKWRSLVEQINRSNKTKNEYSVKISRSDGEEKEKLITEMKEISLRTRELEAEKAATEKSRDEELINFPNLPDPTVPVGSCDADNEEIRRWGELRKFDFDPATHWDIGERLDIIDFERGTKIAGSGFYVLKGYGARLERALINFMQDIHLEQGYEEIFSTVLINESSCYGTGQLPKMKEDMYFVERDGLYLNPTAEVPVTNLHSGEILRREQLPIYYCAYLPSFRREAGRHSETKGIGRVHQFNKVELVKFVLPEESDNELEKLLSDAEEVLKRLGIPYRIRLLCTGDLGFHSSKTYDIEAFAPGMDQWLEVSSCSNFKDFQARRAGIKFRREEHLKSEFVHTLNGSGIALPRTMIALIENFQHEDGSVEIPAALRPYLQNIAKIE